MSMGVWSVVQCLWVCGRWFSVYGCVVGGSVSVGLWSVVQCQLKSAGEIFHSDTRVRFCLNSPQVPSQANPSNSKASLCERGVRRYRCISETCCFV